MLSPYFYTAQVTRVIDADTVEVVVDHGMCIQSVQRIRLDGFDAPELRTDEGKEARDVVVDLFNLYTGTDLHLNTYKDRRSFNRYIGTLWTPMGENMNQTITRLIGVEYTPR